VSGEGAVETLQGPPNRLPDLRRCSSPPEESSQLLAGAPDFLAHSHRVTEVALLAPRRGPLPCEASDVFLSESLDLRQVDPEFAATAHIRESTGLAPPADGLDTYREMAGGSSTDTTREGTRCSRARIASVRGPI
jgi:hypothetical protein